MLSSANMSIRLHNEYGACNSNESYCICKLQFMIFLSKIFISSKQRVLEPGRRLYIQVCSQECVIPDTLQSLCSCLKSITSLFNQQDLFQFLDKWSLSAIVMLSLLKKVIWSSQSFTLSWKLKLLNRINCLLPMENDKQGQFQAI